MWLRHFAAQVLTSCIIHDVSNHSRAAERNCSVWQLPCLCGPRLSYSQLPWQQLLRMTWHPCRFERFSPERRRLAIRQAAVGSAYIPTGLETFLPTFNSLIRLSFDLFTCDSFFPMSLRSMLASLSLSKSYAFTMSHFELVAITTEFSPTPACDLADL